ncbi:Pentapeptide repeat protein [Coleofasciculus chthonoplastes PCC 7420]|uniref:Pentapeptide repeat protein n=2 Tax=Coleofasciculus chthonoplastes TaxID=64178 RepID=B4W4K3_9CYAN|nr:Pentapeptide repeat protein [Coleofasciculus chthonoplastes PCC 7420]
MIHSHPLNLTNQDLRNRSFKGQNLNGADFSGSDIRGCDFSYASLKGANFERVKVGQTLRQIILVLGVALIVALLAVDAIAHTIFGALGQILGGSTWAYILALYISLGMAGAGSGVRKITVTKSSVGQIATVISGTASGALLSFFYAGTTTDNNPQIATAAAVLGGIVAAIVSFNVRSRFVAIAITVAGTVAGYGFAFLGGTSAIAYLSVQKLMGGVIWSCLSVSFLWLTMHSLILAIREIKEFSGTCFRGANLTNAVFAAKSPRKSE